MTTGNNSGRVFFELRERPMIRDDVNNERVSRRKSVSFPPGCFKPNALGNLSQVKSGARKSVRALKQLLVCLSLAAIVLFVCSSQARKGEAAGAPPNVPASVEAAPVSGPQGNTKFNHAKHNQLKCDQCHVRKADAVKPVLPGHGACISCHIKEFTSTRFGICSNCHEGITAVQPPVVAFPERETFGVEFSHKTHATYVGAEKRADCSSCHAVSGNRTTYPAHRECYVCHKAPDQVKPNEKVGGASCGECHTTTGDKKPPSVMSKAYNFKFTHQVHAQRERIACTECHSVLGPTAAAQVSLPLLKVHRGAGFGSCAGCHNGGRAFSGEIAACNCTKCHTNKDCHNF
jgi:c(7)-type cytochrome triheme protein